LTQTKQYVKNKSSNFFPIVADFATTLSNHYNRIIQEGDYYV